MPGYLMVLMPVGLACGAAGLAWLAWEIACEE